MARTLIIGYGNPLRGDDGFGYRAAERLRELEVGCGADVLAVHQLTPELMEPIGRAARVIFIDAAAEGEPGRLVCGAVAPDAPGAGAFTHYATPEGLLAGARALYGKAPPAVLYSVAGTSFEFGEGLTPEVARALEHVVAEIGAASR